MFVEVINYKMLDDFGHVNIDEWHYTSSHGSDLEGRQLFLFPGQVQQKIRMSNSDT